MPQARLHRNGECHRQQHRLEPLVHAVADHFIQVDLGEDRHHQLRQDQHQAGDGDEQGPGRFGPQPLPHDRPGDGAVPPGWKESFGSIVNTMPV